jgi:AcrR family transcriptional regulator
MKQIAEASGMSYGLVYHYFESKVQIFRYLVNFALTESLSTLYAVLDAPGTAWEKIENLSTILAKNALTGESSQYFLIMLQAITQGKTIPGFLDYLSEQFDAYYEKIVPVVIEAQKSGDAVEGNPVVLSAAYLSFVWGLALFAFQGRGLEEKITPEILTNVLRKRLK